MRKLFLLSVACIFMAFHGMAGISPVYTYKMQHLLDSLCQKYKIKGISAAIYIPGDGLWKGVYGESETGVPLTTDMYLPIGSNTKTFTSSIILKLQEQGKLSINDTIGTWIQNQPNIDGQITIKQLLNHTSGLFDYTQHPNFFSSLNSDYNKVWQPEDMLQFVNAPNAAPGGSWDYCNTNYLLLGLIIKQITGQPLYKAYRDMIFDPQQFAHTAFFPQEQPNGIIPHGWTDMGNGLEDMQVAYGWSNTAFLSMANAAGAIVSTAEDNVMFWHNLMSGNIISNNSLAQMKDFLYIDVHNGYGLGLFRLTPVNGRVVFSHGGTCFGYLNENMVDSTSGVCITVLSNQDSLGNNFLFNNIVTPLHKLILQMPPAGIDDAAHDAAGVRIYPNPANNILHVETGNNRGLVFEMYNLSGIAIITSNLDKSNNISIANIPAGLYVTRISKNGTPLQTRKLQVIH